MKVIPSRDTREVVKTVVIAVLVTAIVAFIGGMRYEHSNMKLIQAAQSHAVSQTSKAQAGL